MADDLSDFQPVAVATPAHDVADFEPVSSPASARSPASTSDLSDFEPATPDKIVDPKKAATMFSGMPVETGPHKFTGEHQYGALFTPPEITPKDIERVSPVLSAVNPLFGVTHGLLPRTTNVAASGAANVVSGFANMLNSDEGLLMLGTGGLPKAAQTAVGLAFAAHAIKDSPEAVSEFISAKTDEDRSKALTRILNNFAIGAGGILHGFGRPALEAPGAEPSPSPTGKHAEIVNTAQNELRRAADETTKEVEPVLSKLPGDTQDRVRGIIAKQAAGTELSPDERATLIQVQSFAAQSARDQTAEQFTSPTAAPPTSAPAAPAAPSTPSGIPGGSPPARSSLFAQAKQEAVVAPLVQSAEAASDVVPAAAEAAKQAAAVIASKASSPSRGAGLTTEEQSALATTPDEEESNSVYDARERAKNKTKRADTTNTLLKFLSDGGVDTLGLGDSDHITHVTTEKDGSHLVRVERHTEGTSRAEIVQLRAGESLSDAVSKKFGGENTPTVKSSPTAEVEPPASGQAGTPTEVAKGQPSEAVPLATGAAGVEPILSFRELMDAQEAKERQQIEEASKAGRIGEIPGYTPAIRLPSGEVVKSTSNEIGHGELAAQYPEMKVDRGFVSSKSGKFLNTLETAREYQEAQAALPKIAGPALIQDGQIVAKGEVGKVHDDLVREGAEQDKDLTDATRGFHDENGQPLSRTEAAQRALDTGAIDKPTFDKVMAREPAENQGLHSEDLIAAKEKTTLAEPQFVLPKRAEAAGDKMVTVDIGKFDQGFSRDPQYLGKGQEDVPGRRAAFEQFQKTGNPIETPEVYVSPDGKVTFINGRHRYAALRDQGRESMPVAMSEESIANAKKAGILKPESGETPKTDTRKFKPEAIPDVLKELEEEKPAPETPKTEEPKPAPIDKDEAAKATRGIPGALGDAVRDVLLNDKSVEEAAADNGTTTAKVQDSVNRMRQYLSDKAAKAKAAENTVEETPETPVPAAAPKETWQRTRDEVAQAGDSLAAHRLAVRKAIGEGQAVPLEVLEDFKGSPWADKAREQMYGQQISDTLLGKILKGLTDEGNTLYSDPLFINSVGKPVLRAAVKILQEGIEGGKLAGDAITDALGYLREHIPNLNEDKANEFFDQFFEKPEEAPPTTAAEPVSPESPAPETAVPGDRAAAGETAPSATRTEGDTTSLKRAVVDEQARQQGREEIPTEIRPKDEVIVAQAKARIDSDPSLAKRMVGEILDDGKTGVTEQDAAVLLAERRRMRNERKSWEAVAGDENSSPAQKASAHAELERIEQEQYRLDKASRSAMREWSDVGRMAQREILEDYSLDSLKSKERAARGRALTKEEIDVISKQADRIQELEETAEKTEAAAQEGSAFEEMARIYESTIDSIEREQKLAPRVSEPVLDVARKIVERWKAEADVARANMKNLFGAEGGGVGGVGGGKGAGRKLGQGDIEQSRIETIAKIMRAHVGEIGLKSAEIFDRVLTEFGDKVKSYLEPAWKKMRELVDSEKSPREARDAVKKGIKTKKKGPVEFKARAKAEAVAGEKLSHQTVFELARAHANEGIRGEDNLMKAVHEDIKEAYPDATERDVRRAFVEYGKKTYPSREEVAVHLAEARQLVKIQEDITREMERTEGKIDPETGELIGAEKQGFQRPKNTQKVRELIKQRNELLKKRQGPPDPEKLASADQARQTALENRIADIDKELRTGEKPPEPGEPAPLSSRTETLMAERDAMAEKLREVREAQKPKSSPEEIAAGKAQEAVDRAAAALDRQQRINSGEIKPEPTEKVQPLSDLEKELKDQTEALRKAKRAAEAKTPEEVAASKAQLGVDAAAASLDRWDRILKGEISPEETPFAEPLSNLEEEIKSQVEAMKQAHREIKAAARPKTDLEARQQEAQLKALEKSIAEYERMAREVDLGGHGRRHGPDVEAISRMKDVRDAAKKVVKEMRDARKIIKSPEQIYNEAQTKRIALRLKEAKDIIAKGDFSKPPKRIPPKLNEENVKAKAELQALKDKIDTKRAQVEWDNRPAFERRYDQLTGINRFGKLSRIKTLAKLLAMSVQKLGTTPIHEATSGVLSKTPGYRNLSRLADTEGGFSGDALKKFYGGFFKKGFDDARQAGSPILNIITRGKYGDISSRNPLKTLYGHREGLEKRWYDIPQIIHEMEKSPLLRASFEMNSEKIFKHAAAEGMDITKPEVQGELLETAYRAAERDILMNPNAFAAMVNRGIRMLEEPNKVTGKVTLRGKAGAFAARAMVTFIRVATNHFVQTFNATTGLISGHVRYAHALAKGMENLHPEDANSIMRQLKHGVPGAAMVTLGLVAPQLFGGLDPQRKRKPSDPAFGEMKVGGHIIPRWVVFSAPWLLAGQISATAVQASHSYRRKHDLEPRGPLAGLGAAAAALAETGPLVNEGARTAKVFDDNQRGQYFSDLLESNLVPGLLTEAAEWGDKTPDGKPIQRDPKSFVDHIKMNIPVLRKQVPRKVKSPYAAFSGAR